MVEAETGAIEFVDFHYDEGGLCADEHLEWVLRQCLYCIDVVVFLAIVLDVEALLHLIVIGTVVNS